MDLIDIDLPPKARPFELMWPVAGNPAGILMFKDGQAWRRFIADLGIHPSIPDTVAAKYARAQTLYLLGWLDGGLVKAGELAALVALELALTDRHGRDVEIWIEQKAAARRAAKGLAPKKASKPKERQKPPFAEMLRYLVEVEKLSDADLPSVVRCRGTGIGQLTGETHPTLAERRNALAHGDPFEGWPTVGLLELVRDLINYAFRRYIAEVMS